MIELIPFIKLQGSELGVEFEGYRFDNTAVTFIVVEAPAGTGPKLHSHPYKEVFIILEGEGIFTIGEKTIVATAKSILIVPENIPHKFINKGTTVLKQVDIHLSDKFITDWLEE